MQVVAFYCPQNYLKNQFNYNYNNMSDLYSRIALQKKFQGKELPSEIRRGVNKLTGQNLNNKEARKVLINTMAYKNKRGRERILSHDMKLGYKERGKFEQDTFGVKKLTASELRKQKERQIGQIKRNIHDLAKSANSSDSNDYNELIGQRVGSEGKVRRSFYSAAKKSYSHMTTNSPSYHASSSSGVIRPSLGNRNSSKQLSVDSKANSITGAIKESKNPFSSLNQGGMTRPLGMGGR